MTCRALLVLVACLSLQTLAFAQAGPSVIEADAFSGVLLKPSGRQLAGFGVGMGNEKNVVSVEVSRTFLRDYGIGTGTASSSGALVGFDDLSSTQGSNSSSTLETIGGTLRHDLHNFSKSKAVAYGLAGIDFFRSNSTEYYGQPLARLFPNDAPYLMSLGVPAIITRPVAKQVQGGDLTIGGGIRVPLLKGIGIRAEFKTTFVIPLGKSSYNAGGYYLSDSNGNVISFDRVPGFSLPGPRANPDVLFNVTFGLYYRLSSRRL